jgi:hypothetical protein
MLTLKVDQDLGSRSRQAVVRPQSWINGYGKVRCCTERDGAVVDFDLYLAAASVIVRALICEASHRFRWPGRPTTRQLK